MTGVAVIGYGVVGSGVVEVIKKNGPSIAKRAGDDIVVKKILDIRDFPDSPDKDLLTHDAEEVFNDSSIDIVVETIGGARIAHEFTKRALQSGRHVVTSNKELVAAHGPELLSLAKENGVSYLFEASVGGGIPIIRPLHQCLAANEISGITGILNGTTNYILTQMKREGKSFDEALKEAQLSGYAEADPTADIEGHDACRKIAILSSIAYGEYVDYRNIPTEGITRLTLQDMHYAESLECVIKLVALSRREDDRIFARVSPAVIKKSHPLANVDDVFNAIVVRGDAIGDAMFYGRGAGKLPTASAVVADIIDIVKHIDSGVRNLWERKGYNNMTEKGANATRLMVRTSVRNAEEARRFIGHVFDGAEFISAGKAAVKDEIAFMTKKAAEKDLFAGVDKLKGIGSVRNVENVIRFEEE